MIISYIPVVIVDHHLQTRTHKLAFSFQHLVASLTTVSKMESIKMPV